MSRMSREGKCDVPECGRRILSRRLCCMHYNRLLVTGTTDKGPGPVKGENHPCWTGDEVSFEGGHKRARKLYELGPCKKCGKPGVDRHHKDGNTANNEPSNVEVLCRSCHMKTDGRSKKLTAYAHYRRDNPAPPKPCDNCHVLVKPRRRGMCSKCYERLIRKGGLSEGDKREAS